MEALLRWRPYGLGPETHFVLSAPVLAGNLYVDGGLCKTPPYIFQLAASKLEHVIFRTPITSDNRQRSDSYAENHATFAALDLSIDTEPAKLLESYADIEKHYLGRDHLNCLLSIGMSSGSILELEFPVKHMNILPSQKKWQFETGPVMYLKSTDISIMDVLKSEMLLPCFVHCNRFDRADIFPNYPCPPGYSSLSDSGESITISCHVQLLGSN